MTDMDTVNRRLEPFIAGLRVKLGTTKNVSKGDWRDMSPKELLRRLQEEIDELHEAIHFDGDVLGECYDVAAFAFMLADVFSRQDHLEVSR